MSKLLYLLAAISITTPAAAQLQNLDFENWESPVVFDPSPYNNPVGWKNVNKWFGTEHAVSSFTFQEPVDTVAQQNNYAIRLSVWYHTTKDAAYQTAPINYRPAALKGYYKYEDNIFTDGNENITDTAQVVVILTKWNTSLAKEDTVGLGIFETAAAVSNFTAFNAPIQYFSPEMPEKITVLLDPSIIGRYYERNYYSNADKCSWFTVDNLGLSNSPTGIKEVQPKQSLSVYPNPVADEINFEPVSGEAIITGLSGKQLMNITLKNEQVINVQHLAAGNYVLQINGKNNLVYYSKFTKQ